MSVSTVAPPPPPEFDPLSEHGLRDPASMFLQARESAPVFYYPPAEVFVVSGREDVERTLTDFEIFSNAVFGYAPIPEEYVEVIPPELFAENWLAWDPPAHTKPRRAGQQGFKPSRIGALEGMVSEAANDLIDSFIDRGECDLLTEYGFSLTGRTIAGLLAVSAEWDGFMQQLRTDQVTILASSTMSPDAAELDAAWTRYVEAHLKLRALVEERRENPGEDIVSMLALATNDDGSRLFSTENAAMEIVGLITAGIDTTANLISTAVVLLAETPEQRAQVLADPDLWPRAIEEVLRRRPPMPWTMRLVKQDVELSGVAIPAGSILWTAMVSYSNDPAHYDHPERFDIHRENAKDHVAFGKGRHFCMGAPLSRLEARIGLRTLFERIPEVRPVPGLPPDYNGLMALPFRRGLKVSWS